METRTSSEIEDFIDIEAIPALPASVTKVMELIGSDAASAASIAKAIGEDVGMAARVLKLANSPIYARSSAESVSLVDAVTRLGFVEIEGLCLSVGVARQFEGDCAHVDLVELFKHSLSVAFATEAVQKFSRADECAHLSTETLYIAGLMHDIGHVAIDRQQPELYTRVFDEHEESSEKFHIIEERTLGFGHAEVSARIVRQWGLPELLCQIIEFHHNHEAAPFAARTYAQVLHIADCICNQQGFSDSIEGRIEPFDASAWHDLCLDDADIPAIIELTNEKIESAALFAGLAK